MQITSFQKMLLGVGAGLGVLGGGAGLLVARHNRKEDAEQAYRATPIGIDEFVDRTIAAFDHGTYPSPFEPFDSYADKFREQDGKIHIGPEDVLSEDKKFFPELVSITDDNSYYKEISGREFLRAADTDKDGIATREELTAAVKPFAGDDGKLDEAERKKLLVDGKLAVVVDENEYVTITGWGNSNEVATAYEAASSVLRNLRYANSELKDDGSPAVRISEVQPVIPWGEYQKRLGTGQITSVQPAMARIDAAGNGNGLLSMREVADWLVEHHSDDSLVTGHIKNDAELLAKVLEPQQIGRIDADTLDGHGYYDTGVSKADVDRFYKGSIPTYLDSIEGVKKLRGSAEWEPDPRS